MGKVSFWYGSSDAYTAIASKDSDRLYCLSSGALYKGTTLIAGKTSVTNKAETLAWGSSKTIATINGTDITVSLPAKPTYTLDDVSDGSTRKLANYLPLAGGTITGTLTIAADASHSADITYDSTDNRVQINDPLYVNGSLYVENDIYEGIDKLSDKYAAKTHSHSNYVTKATLTTKGDIFYASAASTPARLAIGSAGQFLTVSNGVPAWGSLPAMGASGTNHKAGLVPDPGSTAGTSKYLREDGTWVNPVSGYATQTWVNNKSYYKSGDSPTFGSWIQMESSSGGSVYLDANEDMSSLTGLYGDSNVTGLQIECSAYIEKHLVVEDECYASDFRNFSDRRLKNHMNDMHLTLEQMQSIPLAVYTYKKDPDTVRVGTYAQDVQKVLPQAVSERGQMLTLDYQALNTAVSLSLVRIVSEQQARFDALEQRLNN